MQLNFKILGLLLGLPLAAPLQASWLGTSDYNACGHGVHGNGSDVFSSEQECLDKCADIRKYWQCVTCNCADQSAGSSDSGSLQDATSRALGEGLVNGDSQTFGVGLVGLGAMALLNSGSSQPSAADQAAQQEAARRRQAEFDAAEAARKKKFDDEKRAAMSDLKGGGGGAGDAHWDDMKDLKDGCCAPAKKVPVIHLKKVDDPLHKAPRPEDVEKFDVLDDWAAAAAYPGTSAMDHESGHIVGCPQGFPYYCGKSCYTEAALDDHRIPCSHGVLKTTKAGPAAELK